MEFVEKKEQFLSILLHRSFISSSTTERRGRLEREEVKRRGYNEEEIRGGTCYEKRDKTQKRGKDT